MLTLTLNKKTHTVATVAEATTLVEAKRGAQGSRSWYAKNGPNGATVTDDTGNVVAFISYNGRAWNPAIGPGGWPSTPYDGNR